MNNKIQNPKTEVPKGMNLNDKDYITELLTCLKDMEKNYVIALTEASNETLFSKLKEMFEEIVLMQRAVYELMFRHGWYSLEVAEKQKINEKHQMLNQEKMDLTAN